MKIYKWKLVIVEEFLPKAKRAYKDDLQGSAIEDLEKKKKL